MSSWHNLSPEEAMKELDSNRSGLSIAEAKNRSQKYGPNELERQKKTPAVMVFLRQFLSPLIYILIAAAIVEGVIGQYVEASVITAVLLFMAIIGYVQETRAQRAMEALMELAAPKAKVRREGRTEVVPAREVVFGDIIVIESGDKVAADARLIEVSNLKVNEATLTGESMPVDKHSETITGDVSLADRKNMVYMATIVNHGRATALVVGTGGRSEVGQIASALRQMEPEKTPLQKAVTRLSHYIILTVLGSCALLAIAGYVRGLEWLDVFMLAVAAAVAAIPEGLPAAVTVALAVGMRLMARRNAIIRKLVAVETLGSATVICSDKTGTLTLSEMTVKKLYFDGRWVEVSGEGYEPRGEFTSNGSKITADENKSLKMLLRIGALSNDALLSHENECCSIVGDPTEGSLVVAAAKAGMIKEKLEVSCPRLDEIPFQSERQYMATLHPVNAHRVAYVKGSTERLLSFSKYILRDGQVAEIQPDDIEAINQANTDMAKEAMRVLAMAYAELPHEAGELSEDHIKGNLILVGLVGMVDPPREDAKEAVKLCKQAGIKVVMITGDNKLTAEAIARQLDLAPGEVLTGTDLEQMSDEELYQHVDKTTIFARIDPMHKLRIVQSFKRRGHIVAMTGDGVNDAPALKAAGIGVAMGITGTDVAKEASDMVLADDNFASVVAAVEEGRSIFNRLRNVILFLLSTGLGELLALLIGVLAIGLAPLVALQILWVNLVTGVVMAVPLALEPKVGDELHHPPRHPRVGLLYPGIIMRITVLSSMLGIGIFLVFYWALGTMPEAEARTIAFCAMVIFEWLLVFNATSDEHTIFKLGVFRNPWMLRALGLAVLLQVAVVYAPPMQVAFDTVPLGIHQWGMALIPGVAIFLLETLRKIVAPRLFSLGKWRPVGEKEPAQTAPNSEYEG